MKEGLGRTRRVEEWLPAKPEPNALSWILLSFRSMKDGKWSSCSRIEFPLPFSPLLQKAQKFLSSSFVLNWALARGSTFFSWRRWEAYRVLAGNLNLLIIQARGAMNGLTARASELVMRLAEVRRWKVLCGLTFDLSGP